MSFSRHTECGGRRINALIKVDVFWHYNVSCSKNYFLGKLYRVSHRTLQKAILPVIIKSRDNQIMFFMSVDK